MTDQPDPGEETALLEATIEALNEELAALRAVACGYCPHCGRGDAAPTVQHWEHQRQRADTAERERDTARQHAAAIAAQRDRLRQRMTALADRWDHGLAVDAPYARTLRDQISAAPFDPDGAMTVSEYTERGRRLWVFRCWGTDTCDGWLGLGHHTQTSALVERERHVAEAHEEPTPASPAEAAAERVRALHTRVLRMEALVCGHCGHTWPCPTTRALNAPAATEATDDSELTLDEARALVDDLGLDLYRAQDALAFVEECCAIADRESRTITTADVREWLKGARCGRQLISDTGPSVREAAADDRRWFNGEREGE